MMEGHLSQKVWHGMVSNQGSQYVGLITSRQKFDIFGKCTALIQANCNLIYRRPDSFPGKKG